MGVILAIVVFSHEGVDEQQADVREFITTYRTHFTLTRDSSLACVIDCFCHFITARWASTPSCSSSVNDVLNRAPPARPKPQSKNQGARNTNSLARACGRRR